MADMFQKEGYNSFDRLRIPRLVFNPNDYILAKFSFFFQLIREDYY